MVEIKDYYVAVRDIRYVKFQDHFDYGRHYYYMQIVYKDGQELKISIGSEDEYVVYASKIEKAIDKMYKKGII